MLAPEFSLLDGGEKRIGAWSPNAPNHIAIVGCGFSGTSALYQLVDRYPAREITVFEVSGDFGPGYAFRTAECPDYLLNNTADTMCLTPASPRAFANWLSMKPNLATAKEGTQYLPRSVYGRFLQDVFSATLVSANVKGIKVNCVPREATSMSEDDAGKVHIGWADGETVVDAAIVTTGRCPNRDDFAPLSENSSATYIPTHVMSSELDDVGMDATVHVLGASLSAYDVVNRLYSPKTGARFERQDGALVFVPGRNKRRVVLCSRSGRLKAVQSRSPCELQRSRFTADALCASAGERGLSLRDIQARVDADAELNHDVVDWASIVDPYAGCEGPAAVTSRARDLLARALLAARERRNFLVDLFAQSQLDVWDAFAARVLRPDEERLYRSQIETAALSYAAPCPIPTAEKLLALIDAGRLTLMKGVRRTRVSDDGSGFELVHEYGTDIATVLVNATGAMDRAVDSERQSALVKSLVQAGRLRPYARAGQPMNGADVDMMAFRAMGSTNIYVANMFLWGPGFFTSSAMLMAMIVDRIVDALLARAGIEATA